MIYFYIALGIILAPFVFVLTAWILGMLYLQIRYMINKDIPYTSKRIQTAIRIFSLLLIKSFRLKYKVINKHLIPNTDAVMFGNHISALDPVVLVYELNHTHVSGLAKKAIFDFPVFKHYITARRVIPMDRTNNRKDAEAMIQAIKQAKEGQLMFVFPEGTRSRDGNLLEFRAGAFRLATKSKKDIYVFKFDKMNEHKYYHLWRKKCTLKFFPVIKYEDYKDLTTMELSDMVRKIIVEG